MSRDAAGRSLPGILIAFAFVIGEDTKRNLKHVKDRAANLADANRTLTFLGSKCVPLGRNADYSAK